MSTAVIAVTRQGIRTALQIHRKMECDVYGLEKYKSHPEVLPIRERIPVFMETIFQNYRQVILLMACGIAVRSIAPLLKSKKEDPAVVVADEYGKYVISLLSGHIGGANELAVEIARITGGQPVITTASDGQGKMAVDMLAKELGLKIRDWGAVKEVTAALVNGGRVGILSEINLPSEIESSFVSIGEGRRNTELDGLVVVTNKQKIAGLPTQIPVAVLTIPNVVLGIGCRKNTEEDRLEQAVEELLQTCNLAPEAVGKIATVSQKKEELAIVKLADKRKVPLEIVDNEQILAVEEAFETSDFVTRTIGVGAVAEPAAYIASHRGKCIAPKTKRNGITISLYEQLEI